MDALPYPKPRTGTMENEPSSDPRVSTRVKNETSNQSSDNTPRKASDPTTVAFQTTNETSASRDAILARHRQIGANGVQGFRKPPVPLPRLIAQRRNTNASTESLPTLPDPPLQQVSPPKTNPTIASTQSLAVPLQSADPDENTYAELSDDLVNHTSSFNVPEIDNNYESFERPPISFSVNQQKTSPADVSSVSLDAMLPSKCMFFEFERTINEYQRRDPRTIIYPQIKPRMPKLTSNELNTLQRCSNT